MFHWKFRYSFLIMASHCVPSFNSVTGEQINTLLGSWIWIGTEEFYSHPWSIEHLVWNIMDIKWIIFQLVTLYNSGIFIYFTFDTFLQWTQSGSTKRIYMVFFLVWTRKQKWSKFFLRGSQFRHLKTFALNPSANGCYNPTI